MPEDITVIYFYFKINRIILFAIDRRLKYMFLGTAMYTEDSSGKRSSVPKIPIVCEHVLACS